MAAVTWRADSPAQQHMLLTPTSPASLSPTPSHPSSPSNSSQFKDQNLGFLHALFYESLEFLTYSDTCSYKQQFSQISP